MKEISKHLSNILIRYTILVLIALPNLWLFYFVLTPLTIYPVYFFLSLFFDSSLIGNIILVSGSLPIEIINACIAGSAYYLLLIFNLSTPGIKIKKRIHMILLSFASLLIINILRIILLSFIFLLGYSWFDITHQIFWYLLNGLFVVGIWFAGVKFFKIKEIPFYSDIKFLYKHSHFKNKKTKC